MATIWLAIPDDEKREYFEHDLPPILPGHTFEFAYMASALPDEGSPDAIVLDVGGMAGNFGNPHFSRLHTDYALRQYPSATLLVLSAMGSYVAELVAQMHKEGLPVTHVVSSPEGVAYGLIITGVVGAPPGWAEQVAEATKWGLLQPKVADGDV